MAPWKKIETLFEHAICINLDRRTDRWNKVKIEFEKIGLDVERFSAVDGVAIFDDEMVKNYKGYKKGRGPKAIIGGLRSHNNVYKTAIKNKWDITAVFEDDALFVNNFKSELAKIYPQVPKDWLMLFLGCVPRKVSNISENVVQIDNCWTAHAYLIKLEACKMLVPIIENYEHRPIDLSWGSVFKTKRVYGIIPPLSVQDETYSDLRQRVWTPFGKETLLKFNNRRK